MEKCLREKFSALAKVSPCKSDIIDKGDILFFDAKTLKLTEVAM